MSYADSLKAQYKNRISGESIVKNGMSPLKLMRLLGRAETRGEGGTGNPSRHNHLSDKYHPYKGTNCWYCDRMFYIDRRVLGIGVLLKTQDHITPKSKGGHNYTTNKIACCSDCNALKANRTPKAFANAIAFSGYAKEMGALRTIMVARSYKIYNKRKNIS
jgi:hypothetical protein